MVRIDPHVPTGDVFLADFLSQVSLGCQSRQPFSLGDIANSGIPKGKNLTQDHEKNIQTKIASFVTNFMTVDLFCSKEIVPLKHLVILRNNFQVMRLSDYVYEE